MKKLILILLLGFFMLSMVSAFEFDNSLRYEKNDMKVTIENVWGWPIFGSDIGTVELKSHSSVNEILKVAAGKDQVVMYYDFTDFKEIYEKGLGEVEFTNLTSGEVVEKDYHYVIWDTVYEEKNNYSRVCNKLGNGTNVCNNVFIGTYTEEKMGWVRLNSKDIPKENVRIGLATDVNIGDTIDGVWTIAGEKIKKHASWSQDLNVNIAGYLKMDEQDVSGSGAIIDSININNATNSGASNSTGKINTGYDFDGGDDFIILTVNSAPVGGQNRTFNLWVNSDDTSNFRDIITYGAEVNTQLFHFRQQNNGKIWFQQQGASVEANSTLTQSVWEMVTFTYDGTTVRLYHNATLVAESTMTLNTASSNPVRFGVFVDAGQEFWNGKMDEVGIWNRSLSQTEITQLFNNGEGISFSNILITPTLNSPANNTLQSEILVEFNWTIIPIQVNITNWTLTVWFANNTIAHLHINTTINENQTVTVIHNDTLFFDASYIWNVESCGTDGVTEICGLSENRTFRIDTIPPIVNITFPPDNFVITSFEQNVTLNYTMEHETPLANCFFNTTFNSTEVNISCITNTSSFLYPNSNPDNMIIFVFGNDTAGNLGQDNVTVVKNTTAPTIVIETPTGLLGSNFIGGTETLNFTSTDTNLESCWFNYNGTNITIEGCISGAKNSTTFILETNNLNLTVYSNDTLGNENSTFTEWSYEFFETDILFNTTAFETSIQTFIINLTTLPSILRVEGILNYNGTRHTTESNCVSGVCSISTSIDIPLVSDNVENENKSFLWEITAFNATSSFNINTTVRNQNVTRIHLEICNATFTNQTLNFTAFDEQMLAPVTPFMFNADFNFWLGTGTVMRNNSFTNSSTPSIQLCILPDNFVYNVDGTVEYDEATGTNYTVRNYYFQKDLIDHNSQDILLGLLLSTESTSFILKVQDRDILPLPDALVFTQRFYAGTGTFQTVQVAKTDDNGKSVGFFEAETGDYRFIIRKDGETLLITPGNNRSQKVVGEEAPFTLTFTVGEDEGASWEGFEQTESLTTDLTYDTTTQIVSFPYVDTSEDFSLALLQVFISNTTSNNSLICNNSLTQSSGIITCNMTGNSTGNYIAKGIIFRGETIILAEQATFIIETFTSQAGRLGLFLGWFIILIAATAFKFNEIAGIILTDVAMIAVNIIGLVNFGVTWITAWIFLSLIILVVLER